MSSVELFSGKNRLGAITESGGAAVSHVAVFCATNNLAPEYTEPSLELIDLFTDIGFGIIYGVADVGLMHDVATRAREKNAHIIGVAIENSKYPQGPSDELITMPNEAARAAKMLEIADGVAVLPGGSGTAREAMTTYDALVAGEFDGPVAVLDAAGHYTKLQEFFAHLEGAGFLRSALAGAGVLFTPSPTIAYAHISENISIPKAQ
jgi:uncharacterized protein (TIGR00730 family)